MAEDKVKKRLEETILHDLDKYENMDNTADKITQAKATASLTEQYFKNATEAEKAKAEKHQALAKYIELGIGVAEFGVSMLVYTKLFHEGLDLEINGTYTIQTFRNLASDAVRKLGGMVK